MHKLTIILTDGSQKTEKALWEDANAATIHAREQMKWKKSIHMIRIVPLAGGAPINVVREEK